MSSKSEKTSQKKARQQELAQEKRKRQVLIIVPIVLGVVAIGLFAYLRLRPV